MLVLEHQDYIDVLGLVEHGKIKFTKGLTSLFTVEIIDSTWKLVSTTTDKGRPILDRYGDVKGFTAYEVIYMFKHFI